MSARASCTGEYSDIFVSSSIISMLMVRDFSQMLPILQSLIELKTPGGM